MPELLKENQLRKDYPLKQGSWNRELRVHRAVDDVTFSILKGETFGLVGESGSGKSTIGRSILRLIEPTAVEVVCHGKDVKAIARKELRRMRKKVQMVFQDPYASLNPRHSVQRIIEEPLVLHIAKTAKERLQRVQDLLSVVGLDPSYAERYPHQFSGGQRQRIGIAR